MARFESLPGTVKSRYANAVISAYGIREAERLMTELAQSIGSGKIVGPNLAKIAQNAVELAKARTPVRTGRLLSRNQYKQLAPHSVVVYNDAPYAKHVEDGTSKMQARPFLRPAVLMAKNEFPQLFVKDYTAFYNDLRSKNKPQ